MKKAKRKKSKTTKALRTAKSAVRKTGGGTQAGRKEGSPRDGPGLNASEQTQNRTLSYSRRVSCRSWTLGVATAVRHS